MTEETFILESTAEQVIAQVSGLTAHLSNGGLIRLDDETHLWWERALVARSERRKDYVTIEIPVWTGVMGIADREMPLGNNAISLVVKPHRSGSIEVTGRCRAETAKPLFSRLLSMWPDRATLADAEAKKGGRPRVWPHGKIRELARAQEAEQIRSAARSAGDSMSWKEAYKIVLGRPASTTEAKELDRAMRWLRRLEAHDPEAVLIEVSQYRRKNTET